MMGADRRSLVLGCAALLLIAPGCSTGDPESALTPTTSLADDVSAASAPAAAPARTGPSTTAALTTTPATTDDPVTTTAAPTTPTTFVSVDDEPVLWSSLERYLEFFSASSTAIAADTGGTTYTLTLDDVVVGDVDGFASGFVASEFFEAGIMLGTLNEAGEVTSTLLLFDPDGESAADALTAFLVSTLGSGTEFEFDLLLEAYPGLVSRSRDGAGEQLWYPNTARTNHSLVVTVVEGAVAGDNLIEVAIVPVADETAATAGVNLVRPSLLSLIPLDE